MSANIIMPEMGEGVIEGTIVRWLKKVGDPLKLDEPVLEIETDKVTVEITAEAEGVLLKIHAHEGQTVAVGTVLAVIGTQGEVIPQLEAVGAVGHHAPSRPIAPVPSPNTPIDDSLDDNSLDDEERAGKRDFDGVRVSPVVARMLQVHDIDVHELNGSGRDGRITKKDVLAYLDTQETAPTPVAPVAPTPIPTPVTPIQKPKADPIPLEAGDELMPLNAMRRAIAEHMVRSKHTSPHVTTVFEFDFSAVAKHRAAHKDLFERDGVKLTYMPYIVSAVVYALKKHRMVNAQWSEDGLLLKREINMGIAVAVPSGLIVPVIKRADNMNLLGLGRAINDLSERGRKNQLKPDEVKGGTFTITNHGVAGSLIGTPIINQPQVGILGIGMIEKRVKVIHDAIAIRPCAYISFSFDHRVLDGATADAFVMDIKQTIENFS
ncbi:MAG: 2-oxo acid dehydrogenase subunit E2 [Anaerolineae bacterium]|nr:2-oxo acid dehydrogenase subunit E2 [Anaerolineae bacterium]